MAGLVDRFGRDFERLVPKMNQYLMGNVHDIYIGMNEPRLRAYCKVYLGGGSGGSGVE